MVLQFNIFNSLVMIIDIFQALSGHENIIRLQHVIKAENDRDIYLTFDHMETGMRNLEIFDIFFYIFCVLSGILIGLTDTVYFIFFLNVFVLIFQIFMQ